MWPGAREVGFRPRGCTGLGWMVSEGFELLGLEFEVFAEAYSRVGEQAWSWKEEERVKIIGLSASSIQGARLEIILPLGASAQASIGGPT